MKVKELIEALQKITHQNADVLVKVHFGDGESGLANIYTVTDDVTEDPTIHINFDQSDLDSDETDEDEDEDDES